jgi:hypothetical protein
VRQSRGNGPPAKCDWGTIYGCLAKERRWTVRDTSFAIVDQNDGANALGDRMRRKRPIAISISKARRHWIIGGWL